MERNPEDLIVKGGFSLKAIFLLKPHLHKGFSLQMDGRDISIQWIDSFSLLVGKKKWMDWTT